MRRQLSRTLVDWHCLAARMRDKERVFCFYRSGEVSIFLVVDSIIDSGSLRLGFLDSGQWGVDHASESTHRR